MSFEAAATIPLALITAAIGLFKVLGIPEPPKPGEEPSFAPGMKLSDAVYYAFRTKCSAKMSDNGQAIIIYGASTTVGIFATQLAKRAGFHVVGVAGSSADYARSAGTDVIVDYRGKTPEELVRLAAYLSSLLLLCTNNSLTWFVYT